jgi:hypothetical protein
VKFEFLKGQPLDFASQRVLFLLIQNVRVIPKSFRQLGLVLEQAQLARHAEANFIFPRWTKRLNGSSHYQLMGTLQRQFQ